MKNINFDVKAAKDFFGEHELDNIKAITVLSRDRLISGDCPGNDFLGWIKLPNDYDRSEFNKIKKAAVRIISDSDVLLVIGIGGSYLGARAAIDFVHGSMYNELPSGIRKTPQIYYIGNNISSDYISDIISLIADKDFSINVISKSGTTTEPAIAFRIFKKLLEEKYGADEASKRIYATTDRQKGALKTQAENCGYETFVVPDDIGGRYSVLTAVGLLPIAVSGIDIDALMNGAASAMDHCINTDYSENMALQYAAIRNIFYNKGKSVEILVGYEPSLHYVFEWWKQLFGESEGKDKKGLYPASAEFTTDLHSLGQFIQDGSRTMFETVLNVKTSNKTLKIETDSSDLDGLNYLRGKELNFVNQNAMKATMLAHSEGGVPNLVINIENRDAYTLGELFYFFEFSCGISGLMLGVNPFNQPGVENYKKNMFALLGKPGYEDIKASLNI